MNSFDHEDETSLIDLGAVSAETKGSPPGEHVDLPIGFRQAMGLSQD